MKIKHPPIKTDCFQQLNQGSTDRQWPGAVDQSGSKFQIFDGSGPVRDYIFLSARF